MHLKSIRLRIESSPIARRFIVGGSWLLGGGLVSTILTFASTFLVAGYLGVKEYGTIALIISTCLLISGLFTLRTTEAVTKFVLEFVESKEFEKAGTFSAMALLIDLMGALIGASIIYVLSGPLSDLVFGDAEFQPYFALYAITPLLVFSYCSSIALLRANNRFAMISSVEVLYSFALLLGNLYLVSTDATWEAFLYWNIVASAIRGSLLLTYFLFCFAKLNLRFIVSSQTISYIKDFASGMKLMFTSTATFVVKTAHMQLDTILLGHLFGPAASGAYKLARSFTQLLAFPTNALFQVSFPEFVQLLHKKQADKFKRVVKKLILVTLAVSLVYWLGSVLIAPLLIPLLLGDSYGVTAELLPILVFGLSITMLSQYWHSALVAVNNAGQVAISMLIALVGQISMLLMVAPILGIKAAAVAFVFYSLTRALLLFSKFKKFVLNKI